MNDTPDSLEFPDTSDPTISVTDTGCLAVALVLAALIIVGGLLAYGIMRMEHDEYMKRLELEHMKELRQ